MKDQIPSNINVVFVLGGPGSGKGTQCEKIVQKFGYTHLSAGDLLRQEIASGSELGKQCQAIMNNGGLVAPEVALQILKQAIQKSEGTSFLIDGFPRQLYQGHEFERSIAKCSKVIAFDCPMEVMEQRLLQRGQHSGRADDNIETIKKRFHTFVQESMPVMEYYQLIGKLVKIDATRDPDIVFQDVERALSSS